LASPRLPISRGRFRIALAPRRANSAAACKRFASSKKVATVRLSGNYRRQIAATWPALGAQITPAAMPQRSNLAMRHVLVANVIGGDESKR
jgi:hypothetical protein